MIFKVADDYKGSIAFNSVGKALSAGMTISIPSGKVIAPDVRAAIKQKILIPMDADKYNRDFKEKSSEAMVVNLTGRVLVMGDVVLRPWASLLVDREIAEKGTLVTAEARGLIHILTDGMTYQASDKKEKTDSVSADGSVDGSSPEPPKKEEFVIGENRKVEPTVWDFRQQKQKVAKTVPAYQPPIMVNEEGEIPEADFIDREEEQNEIFEKENPQRSVVGDKKEQKTDAPLKKELRPKKEKDKVSKIADTIKDSVVSSKADTQPHGSRKVKDDLQNLLESLTDNTGIDFESRVGDNEEIKFVDKEQQEEKIRKRRKRK